MQLDPPLVMVITANHRVEGKPSAIGKSLNQPADGGDIAKPSRRIVENSRTESAKRDGIESVWSPREE